MAKATAVGPGPDDPVIRGAAARLAGYRLAQSRRRPRWLLPLGLGLIVVSQAAGVLSDPPSITVGSVALVVLAAGLGVYSWLTPRLLEARAQLLNQL